MEREEKRERQFLTNFEFNIFSYARVCSVYYYVALRIKISRVLQ